MRMRDIMTTNVVTIPSNTSLLEARRIMAAHNVKRLPVVDKNKLIGIVAKETLDHSGPSQLTTFSIHELTYMLNKITIAEVMSKKLVTLPPDATAEEGVATAQSHKVGSVLIVDKGNLVGIVTTKDMFYKILNPILGINMPGSRIVIQDCSEPDALKKVLDAVATAGAKVMSMWIADNAETKKKDFVLHVDKTDPAPIISLIEKSGCKVEPVAR